MNEKMESLVCTCRGETYITPCDYAVSVVWGVSPYEAHAMMDAWEDASDAVFSDQ